MAEQYISFQELVNALNEIIKEIRSSSTEYSSLIKSINDLELNYKNLTASTKVEVMFNAYKKIQNISIEIRKLLQKYNIKAELYDNISYAFYYTNSNGQTIRYSTDKLDLKWLRVSSTGELQINLTKAISDISSSGLNNLISEIFTKHYESYYNLITGTYNERKPYKGKTYKRAPLNKGHISEAFEEHLSQHHPGFYSLLNSGLLFEKNNESVLSKMAQVQINSQENWENKNHESVTAAWMHVRHSMGSQKGTVAGDVGKYQVKFGTVENPKLRLARLSTLKNGIKLYSLILSDEDSLKVATLLASYMSERVNKTSERLVDAIIDKEVSTLLENFDTEISQINIPINI